MSELDLQKNKRTVQKSHFRKAPRHFTLGFRPGPNRYGFSHTESGLTLNKVFVGGLPQNCTDDMLLKMGEQHGSVDIAQVMTDKHSGRTKGFGFITFTDISGVDAIVDAGKDKWVIADRTVEVKRIDNN